MPSEKKRLLRKIASGFLYWGRIIIMGIIVILTGILFGIMIVIGEALDFMLKKLDKD